MGQFRIEQGAAPEAGNESVRGRHPSRGCLVFREEQNRRPASPGRMLMEEAPTVLFSWGKTFKESHVRSYIGLAQLKASCLLRGQGGRKWVFIT